MFLLNKLLLLLLAGRVLANDSGEPRHHNHARQTAKYAPKVPPLDTDWTSKVGTNPWPEYPRPQLERSEWQNLNGIWQYQNAPGLEAVKAPPFGQALANEVLIPSCLESALSGIQGNHTLYSWLSTTFTIPKQWKNQNVLLNFGAVDYEATVFINGKQAGFNRGGYFSFTIDITQFVSFDGSNELLVFVHDPTDSGDYVIPIGKQRLIPAHIFYTPCSGIWQSVWIESAPANYITELDISAGMDGQVNVTAVSASGGSTPVDITIFDGASDKKVASHKGTSDQPFSFKVESPKLWSPDSPTLYNISVKMGGDEVKSYTGFRTISKGTVNGILRPLINGEFTFVFGTLDQGYWPDGIYTPPNREAMVYDLHFLKSLGFNMLRKHIKVEPALFYRACDEIGLLVIQDMPSPRPLQSRKLPNGNDQTILPDAAQQQEFNRQLELLVKQHKSYPSIFSWVIYNEGWGQVTNYYPEIELTERVRQLDPTRLVDATSGWIDHGQGDFSDNHHYSYPQCGAPFYSIPSSPHDPSRIAIQGEFGGVGTNVSIEHLWNNIDAINGINMTYELADNFDIWNYRSHLLLSELKDQITRFSCSGGIWTQTTDVEGEVNGLLTYDRRLKRVDEKMWKDDIQALYDAAKART
ncbi:beta-galactosidase [Aspergillus udagawae]|uniref:Beta-galactosidase n=1 Tax=Aspergillus udagawae TaxID=91492 RepID=A0ABQ1ADQ1_9EURO|nr:beta-galactosidase [Aspergillus udagawae]GFF79660.1 beta-galactosidase [Aspergillus udagawae]GFG22062.1 beta-galactosidase [Aspergillus udagawae]